MQLPKHEVLYLEHNPHKKIFKPVEEWIKLQGYDWEYEWRDNSSKMRSIATNDIWILHWYPKTTVGFIAIAAPTLDELLDMAMHVEKEEERKGGVNGT